MAFNHLMLPQYQVANGFDVSPISNALQSNQDNLIAQNRLGLQRRQVDLAERADTRQGEAHAADMEQRKRQQAGALAQMGLAEKDPTRRQNILDRIISMHADKTKLGPEYLNPDTAFDLIVREAQGFMGEKDQAQLGLIRGQTAAAYAQAEKDRREAAIGGKASLVPVWGKDAQGNDILLQTRPDGSAVQTRLPPGVSVTGKTGRLDLGTHWGITDQAGNLIHKYPKDLEGKEAAEARGRASGQAQVDLPKVQENAAATTRYVDEVLKDPNLPNVTGWQARLPTVRSTSIDTEERIAQLGGRAFLSAFESLKGGGQITEIEGKKATDALARLTNLKQSDKGFVQALNDFKREVSNLVAIAERRARTGGGASGPPPADPLGIR
jgi:hypothetical protein